MPVESRLGVTSASTGCLPVHTEEPEGESGSLNSQPNTSAVAAITTETPGVKLTNPEQPHADMISMTGILVNSLTITGF